MGVVVLDPNHGKAGGRCVAGGQIVRMAVACDRLGLEVVQAGQVVAHVAKGIERLDGLQVSDVLAQEDLGVIRHRHGTLEMSPNRQEWGKRSIDVHGKRGVAAGATENQLAPQDHPRHGVIHMSGNGSVVHEEEIGYSGKARDSLPFIGAARLVRQIAAGGDHSNVQHLDQDMVERSIREHDSQIGVSRRHGWCDGTGFPIGLAPTPQEDDGRLRRLE